MTWLHKLLFSNVDKASIYFAGHPLDGLIALFFILTWWGMLAFFIAKMRKK